MVSHETVAPSTLYYWVHHTGQYDGNSGVQRVVRSLANALIAGTPAIRLIPVRWCPRTEAIVHAEQAWLTNLAQFGGPTLTESVHSGQSLHLVEGDEQLASAWLFIPEVPHVPNAPIDGPALRVALGYAQFYRMRTAAIFYDLIPIRTPGYEGMRADHESYATALATCDRIFPISADAGEDLFAWWTEREIEGNAARRVLPMLLPHEIDGVPRRTDIEPRRAGKPARFIMFGTVEPRKNQIAAMRAFNAVCARCADGVAPRLDIVGHLHPAVATAFHGELARSQGRIRWHQYLDDRVLQALIQDSDASIFVSLKEGYGLPVSESLWLGKPCIASDRGSVAEICAGGGCLLVDPDSEEQIEAGIMAVVSDDARLVALSHEASTRPLATWRDYANGIVDGIATAPPVPQLAIVEGSRTDCQSLFSDLVSRGVIVRRLHWNAREKAILPGFSNGAGASPEPGFGDLLNWWAVIPLTRATRPAEAIDMAREARGLGVECCFLVDPDFDLSAASVTALTAATLVIFPSDAMREAALALSFRHLTKLATLRRRWVVPANGDWLQALRLATDGLPEPLHADRPRRVFYWCGMTAAQPFNTGVQRVVRQWAAALLRAHIDVIPVRYDEERSQLVPLDTAERDCMAMFNGPRFSHHASIEPMRGDWVLLPEIVVPSLPAGSNPSDWARARGLRVAAFCHDLIPNKLRTLYDDAVRDAFRPYWDGFATADLTLTNSWIVAADLRRYLASIGRPRRQIVPCWLSGEIPGQARIDSRRESSQTVGPLKLLMIGTIEPRKNYLTFLDGLHRAQAAGLVRPIQLTIVGRRAGFADFENEVDRLAAEIGDVVLAGMLEDHQITALMDACDLTAFASCEEGFGLPIVESLWSGRPALCHDGSAMAEIGRPGGVIMTDMSDAIAIADALTSLANRPELLTSLEAQVSARHLRTWDEFAEDTLHAIGRVNAKRAGIGAPALITGQAALTCAITTYNRGPWLTHSLPRLLEAARPFGSDVQVVVCDNASTDNTPEMVSRFAADPRLKSVRNRQNVGMLGNLGATATASDGAFVWLLGDDDLVIPGAIESVLEGIHRHREIEMVYMNYMYSLGAAPSADADVDELFRAAKPIGYGGPNRYVEELREVTPCNENFFTAIYACAFRRDHALRAYQIDTSGAPFSSLKTCVPSSVYALQVLQKRPAYWLGDPAVMINMNVSWLRWALLWHLERNPDLFDEGEMAGVDPHLIDIHRAKHCWNAGPWSEDALLRAEDAIRTNVSISRLIERCKHVTEFQSQLPQLFEVYRQAEALGRLSPPDVMPAEVMFEGYNCRQ